MYRFLSIIIGILVITAKSESRNPRNLNPDVGLDIIQLATKYGYPIESHEVQTEDGYLLTLHRIPYGVNGTTEGVVRPAVLLMHGLLSSSVDWVNMGPGLALAYLLADDGFDVWMGNERGNTWSRKHITLDPHLDEIAFYNFSFHEMGVYDQPAMIDHILETTGQEKLVYIGHSQGTTTSFIMGSERPEYNDKLRLLVALAPVAYMGHLTSPLFRLAADNYDYVMNLVNGFKIHEFLPHYDFISDLSDALCSDTSSLQDVCVLLLNVICGFDYDIDPNFVPVITTGAPAGVSINQVLHYLQEIKSGNFSQFDYGTDGNIAKYGQDTPPLYDVSKITAPVILHYANNDMLAAVEDVLKLAGDLPNLVNAKEVPFDEFNHLDFLWAQHVVPLLYNDLIAEIEALK